MSSSQRVIAVVGATGAQGLPVVKHLLSSKDGKPSPWKVRALTRNASHRRAKELEALGAELVQGSFMDSGAITKLLDGVYGAFINTDGFTVGAAAELTAAFNIYEIARKAGVQHFVWSNLDYCLQLGDYDPVYGCDHYNAKGRFADYLLNLPEDRVMTRTVFTNGPYMDMLGALFSPFKRREDGTYVWAFPIGETGRIPLIALDDLGWWVRWIYDNKASTNGKNIAIASEPVTGAQIVDAFQKATGLKGEYKALSMDDYFALWENGKTHPVASAVPDGKTWEQNFRGFFSMWRDNIVKRDMEWIRKVKPDTWTLERWMRENKYHGRRNPVLLKNVEDQSQALRHSKTFTAKL